MLQFWRAFDLDSKRLVLDTQGNAMKTEKESSLKSRKKLAETTKGFRKLADSDKITAVGGLLRAYQEEIDSLTKRAKFAENAFFMLYKGLYAAPDPVPSLEAAAADTKLAELEEANHKLARELQDYEAEFASLTNQDITIRTLEARVSAFENEMDALVHTRVDAQCRDLDAQLAAKDVELTQLRLDYERQLESSRSDLRDAFRRLDAMQSDLFAHKQQRSGAAPSVLDRDLFADDALVTQTLQLENAQLKQQLDALLSVGASSDSSVASAEASGALTATGGSSSSELADRDATIQSLRHDVFRLQDALATAQTTAARERERLDDALAQAQATAQELTRELAARPTVERHNDVLHQLHVLQQLEYNIVDDDDDALDSVEATDAHTRALSSGEASDSAALGASTRTEKILVSRVRRLEHALQQSELLLQATRSELTEARDDLTRKTAVVDEQRVLLRNLEEHVATLESRKRSAMHPVDVGSEILLDAIDAGDALAAGPSVPAPLLAGAGVAATDTKMLEIVRGQRDRFRERMKELESEKRRLEDLAASSKASVTRLESDNMQLYHKIRYLQSYRSGASSSSSTGHRVTPSVSMAQLEAGGADVEAKYRGLYEEKLNPFVQFNRMETQQRYANLNTVDKVLLNSAKMFLGHRVTRNIAFGYIVLLHFLVFATLYSFMHGCGISNV